jgi:hypothetical protein
VLDIRIDSQVSLMIMVNILPKKMPVKANIRLLLLMLDLQVIFLILEMAECRLSATVKMVSLSIKMAKKLSQSRITIQMIL